MSEGLKIGSNFNSSIRYSPEPQIANGIISNVASSLVGAASSGVAAAGGDFNSLLQYQIEAQKQMMLVSMQSNLSRTEHETKMTPVRNLRVA